MAPSPAPGTATTTTTGVIPARLAFLAIYNPSLGVTDETIDDQILYYYSSSASAATANPSPSPRHRQHSRSGEGDGDGDGGRNERLRQIGLAQGMVEFGRGFSGGSAVDAVDTERSRVVLRELEDGWWILASIDLTRLPSPATASAPGGVPVDHGERCTGVEYSSREVKPAELLAQDLLRAHAVFLLHHGGSLGTGLDRAGGGGGGGGGGRARLATRLARYWDLFLATWNVGMRANPARDALGGIRMAACGELGVGVGEEERGSGEREVLEGFVGRVEGLVDLVVSKFGEGGDGGDDGGAGAKGKGGGGEQDAAAKRWLGMGSEPGAEDGAIFLGVGALSRRSLRDVTYWMEDLYVWGENAYGVIDSAATTKPARRKKTKSRRFPSSPRPPSPPPPPQPSSTRPTSQPPAGEVTVFGPPPPLIGPGRSAITDSAEPSQTQRSPEAGPEGGEGGGGMDKLVNYLKMGYGTYWTLGSSPSGEQHNPTAKGGGGVAKADDAQQASKDDAAGHYLVGLVGDVDEDGTGSDTEDVQVHGRSGQGSNRQTHLRTLTVELKSREDPPESQDTKDSESQVTEHDKRRGDGRGDTMETDDPVLNSQGGNKTKLQAVVYVNRPFIFTFLFQPGTQSLASEGLYRSLHYQVAPLRKHLINSTAYRPGRPDIGSPAVQIYDLVWDPRAMTVHSTIPNIPDPVPSAQAAGAQIWTRAEALSTHTQILNMLAATRADDSELERTAKTTRGWWIVWSRIIQRKTRPAARPPSSEGSERRRSDADSFCEDGEGGEGEVHGVVTSKEIFLIRKAGDRGSSGAMRGVSGSYVTGGGGGWADGASRLAQGIGIDTRKYIEGLLSLNR